VKSLVITKRRLEKYCFEEKEIDGHVARKPMKKKAYRILERNAKKYMDLHWINLVQVGEQ
jgi:hypothetical protein